MTPEGAWIKPRKIKNGNHIHHVAKMPKVSTIRISNTSEVICKNVTPSPILPLKKFLFWSRIFGFPFKPKTEYDQFDNEKGFNVVDGEGEMTNFVVCKYSYLAVAFAGGFIFKNIFGV